MTPIILIAMIAIFLEDRFPLIFMQKRYGKNRKIFYIYKLRTMKKIPQIWAHMMLVKIISLSVDSF